MYASVWNRVVLLITGLAFGWNLVHYQIVARSAVKSSFIRLLLASTGGAVVITLLALRSPGVGLGAGLVFLASALVGYAGNAKQTGPKPQIRVAQLERTEPTDPRIAVMLVHDGEPRSYDGPADWVERVVRWQSSASESKHWLTRPRVFSRVRAAYDQMGGTCDYNESLAALGHVLAQELGTEYVVVTTFLRGGPRPVEGLSHWAEMGISKIVLVPVGLDATLSAELRDRLTRSRAREVGLRIRLAPWSAQTERRPLPEGARFGALVQGDSIPIPTFAPDVVADLRQHVLAHLSELQ